jgi:hypothetical protein
MVDNGTGLVRGQPWGDPACELEGVGMWICACPGALRFRDKWPADFDGCGAAVDVRGKYFNWKKVAKLSHSAQKSKRSKISNFTIISAKGVLASFRRSNLVSCPSARLLFPSGSSQSFLALICSDMANTTLMGKRWVLATPFTKTFMELVVRLNKIKFLLANLL